VTAQQRGREPVLPCPTVLVVPACPPARPRPIASVPGHNAIANVLSGHGISFLSVHLSNSKFFLQNSKYGCATLREGESH